MAIEIVESTHTPNEGRVIWNDGLVDLDGRINEVELGIDAYSTTSASFVQPAVSATVSVTVDETRWMAVGQPVYMTTGGHYSVSSITDTTHVVLTNLGITGNASVGATVASGKKVSPSGASGVSASSDAADVTFTPGSGVAATDVQAAIEEVATDVTDHLSDTSDAHDASAISYAGGTGMSATDVEAAVDELATEKANASDLTAHTGDTSDAHDASAISFVPAGTIAATDVQAAIEEVATEAGSGSGHTIQDESTPLTARANLNFTGAGVTATDDSGNNQTDVTIPGKHIVQDEGSSLTARTNLDFQGAGVTVTDNSGSDKTIVTVPAGGPTGDPAYSTTSASFTQPSVASTVSVSVDTTAWMGVGQVVYVVGGGYYTVSSITSGTVVVLNNLGYTGNAAPAATVATAAKVSPGGLVGATGSSGYRTLVTLGSDVVNATTSFADITGLSFSVTSGTTYRFYALIAYEVNATTTGSIWAINGPAASIISYVVQYFSSVTALAVRCNTAYNSGSATTTSQDTTNQLAIIQGIVHPTSSGTIVMRFASEVAVASALTAKAGSTLEWW